MERGARWEVAGYPRRIGRRLGTDALIFATRPRRWFRPTDIVRDGVNVGEFLNRVGPGSLKQSNPANQVALPVITPAINRQLSCKFVAANVTRYISTEPAADWANGSDGKGFESWRVLRYTLNGFRSVTGTCENAAGQTGFEQAEQGGLANVRDGVIGAGVVVVLTFTAGTPGLNTWFWDQFSHGLSVTPNRRGQVNTQLPTTGVYLNPPVVGAPSRTGILGARSDATAPFDGDFADWIMWDRVLTDSERVNNVSQYMLERYGLPP